jgi:hypothetical protein
MAVNVSATFRKDEREYNGLEAVREDLINRPLERVTIVATIETTAITTNVRDGGTQTPTVRLVNVEAMHGDDALTSRKLLDKVFHERTGKTAPPPSLFDDRVDAMNSQDQPDAQWDDQEEDSGDEVAAKRVRKK